jgi:hypothetical protein
MKGWNKKIKKIIKRMRIKLDINTKYDEILRDEIKKKLIKNRI